MGFSASERLVTAPVRLPRAHYPHARILIIAGLQVSSADLRSVLAGGDYRNVTSLPNDMYLTEALVGFEPELLIAYRPDGLPSITAAALEVNPKLPILLVSTQEGPAVGTDAFGVGVTDYLSHPFDPVELLWRTGNILKTVRALKRTEGLRSQLAEQIERAQIDSEIAQIEMLARIARIIDQADDDLSQHTYRVARVAAAIATELEQPPAYVIDLARAARVHDIGKVIVPHQILSSPETLRRDERALIREHPRIGALILTGGASSLMLMAERIALSHHERWDGAGYPDGLKGEEIPLEARIVAVADSYDAMTHDRPYRSAISREAARTEIAAKAGSQFDASVVSAFLRLKLPDHPGAQRARP